jgi:hypothetical protein
MKTLNYLLGISLVLCLSQSLLASTFKVTNETKMGNPVTVLIKQGEDVMAREDIITRHGRKNRGMTLPETISGELIYNEPATLWIFDTVNGITDIKYKGVFPAGKSFNIVFDEAEKPVVKPAFFSLTTTNDIAAAAKAAGFKAK